MSTGGSEQVSCGACHDNKWGFPVSAPETKPPGESAPPQVDEEESAFWVLLKWVTEYVADCDRPTACFMVGIAPLVSAEPRTSLD
jgi:hypothetical protein